MNKGVGFYVYFQLTRKQKTDVSEEDIREGIIMDDRQSC